MSTMSQVSSGGEVAFLLAQGRSARTCVEEREYRARLRTARGLLLALVMIWGYDAVLFVTGAHT
jgi:hypothetical protein